MRGLLPLNKLHLNGQEKMGGGVGAAKEKGKSQEGAEAGGGVHRGRGVMEIVLGGGHDRGRGERLMVPFFRLGKPTHRSTWFSDALFKAVGGYVPGNRRVLEKPLLRGGEEKGD